MYILKFASLKRRNQMQYPHAFGQPVGQNATPLNYIEMNICSFYILPCDGNMNFGAGKMRGPYRKRQIDTPPAFKNFKPSGIPRRLLKSVIISLDEYEAIRLADYAQYDHQRAAKAMGISRPTFTRLIDQARYKFAKAFIEGLEIIVEGGNVEMVHTRLRCLDCEDEQVVPFGEQIAGCRECGSTNLEDTARQYLQSNAG